MNVFTILTCKEISNLLNVSERTSKRYIKDIKSTYDIEKVTIYHLSKYFKVPYREIISKDDAN